MELEILPLALPGDGSDGGELFELQAAGASRVFESGFARKGGRSVAVLFDAEAWSLGFRFPCGAEGAIERFWSNLASRVFQRCGKG